MMLLAFPSTLFYSFDLSHLGWSSPPCNLSLPPSRPHPCTSSLRFHVYPVSLYSLKTTQITTTDPCRPPLLTFPFFFFAVPPGLELRDLPVLINLESHSYHHHPAISIPCSAQPSSALLRQLSLFLRHSSGAISLTRPAHFFPLLTSPTPPPCLFQYYTLLLLHFSFSVFFYI